MPGEAEPAPYDPARTYRLEWTTNLVSSAGGGLPSWFPVAVDSGRLWSRGIRKYGGLVTIRFGEAIPAGLGRDPADATHRVGGHRRAGPSPRVQMNV